MLSTQSSFPAAMALNHPIPTTPCKNLVGPAAKLPLVLQLPLFTQAVIGFCGIAAGIPGTWADHAQYLSTMQLHFADQADFLCITEQKGLFDD
ncbi:hypothetical protein C0989_005644 [Termitomyces sp. Mn162]|nr:hypothetical protein C0989_005644 [Termitomyces sp. Mn162]